MTGPQPPREHREERKMRRIVARLFVSLDGVTEAPEKWTSPYFNEQVGQELGAQMAEADTLLLGRRTYEEFAAFWPDKTAEDDPFAGYINTVPKLVVSTTLKSVEWHNSSLLSGDVAEQLTMLKQQLGKDISITGSGTLVGSLLWQGLLDELRLLLYPVVVGSGRRLFQDGSDQVPLELVDSRAFDTGVVALVYQPART
jgi:dihydrofolate reductase